MKNSYTDKTSVAPTSVGDSGNGVARIYSELMNLLIKTLVRIGLLKKDLDYHLVRASMVIIYFFFGYQKWFPYEAQGLIPFFKNGPLISWMYPIFGIQGSSWFLGVSEWLFGTLILLGFWDKRLGILGALGSCLTFVMTITIIPGSGTAQLEGIAGKMTIKFAPGGKHLYALDYTLPTHI